MKKYSAVMKRHATGLPYYLGILIMLYMLAYPANTTAQESNPDTLDFSLRTIDGTIIDRFNELPKDPRAYLNKYITPEDHL